MKEPEKRDSVIKRAGGLFVSALKRLGMLERSVDQTPSKNPIAETHFLAEKLANARNAWEVVPITTRLEVISRQY